LLKFPDWMIRKTSNLDAPPHARGAARSLGLGAVAIALLLGLTAHAACAGTHGEIVGITSVTLDQPLKPDSTSILRIDARILPGWHINSDHPLNPDYIATQVRVSLPKGITASAVEYPAAQQVTLEFSGREKLAVFSGAARFEVPLAADADFRPGPGREITATIDYQACNDSECLRPASVSATVDLGTLGASRASGAPPPSADGAIAGAGVGAAGSALASVFAMHGWVLGFFAVLLGGIALNLTPCVYPLIGVTIAYFGNEGGGPRRILVLAILYVLGIAAMFSAVGVAVAMSGGLFGAALQNPWVLVGIAALMLALAASSFGLFSLQPPQWMLQRAGAARPGYAGAFLMGLGMGVVAAPCIGPIVLGLLLMVEQSGSAVFGFALFFTLAVGLGLPYIALAMAAGSIRRLPRSGEWLAWVEQLFGFVLIGLAIYFLDPVLPNHIASRGLPYYAAGAGIFLGFITPAGRNWRPFLVIRSALGVVAAAALIYLLVPRAAPHALSFEKFNTALLDSAAAEKRPVLIDFSADWCIPCREMERSTFVDPSVVSEAQRFVRLRADLTADDKSNQELISRYRIQGVPTTLLIDSHGRISENKVGYIGPGEMLAALRRVD
jgi:thioredoxin:protein disulfide reductase